MDKSEIINRALQIPGWMTARELEALWNVHSDESIKSAIEIGAYCGRSTVVIASALQRHGGELIVIDTFEGSREHRLDKTVIRCDKMYDEFRENTRSLWNIVDVLKMPSQDAGAIADCITLDSDHDYESVKRDLDQWLPATKIMLCHDYCMQWPGVYRAIKERATRDIEILWLIDSLVAIRKREWIK